MGFSHTSNTNSHNTSKTDNNQASGQVIQYYFLDHEYKLNKASELPNWVDRFVWESQEPLHDEMLFTLAYSECFADYTKLTAHKADLKEHEREEIARTFLGVAESESTDTALSSVPDDRFITNKNTFDLLLRNLDQSISKEEFDQRSIIVAFKSTYCSILIEDSTTVPIFELTWKDDAYKIGLRSPGSVDSSVITLGYIRTLNDANLFRDLFRYVLRLNSHKE